MHNSHSILSNVYYLIISRKHFHINIYIYTYKYIFFTSLCTPTNWITTYTLLPSHLFPIKKLRIYNYWPALGVMDPSVLLRNFRENRDFLFDMIWVFFFFLRTQKFRHILPYCINLVHLYSTYFLWNSTLMKSFAMNIVICCWHLPLTALVVHIEQLHVHNYVRIYD